VSEKPLGVLQDFERHLEGAVEGFFARAFKSGLQPVELAKALQRYGHDNRYVAEDGVVVPNTFRITISPKDAERLSSYGDELARELAGVVERTAAEEDWLLRGPARVQVVAGDSVRPGRFELTGRVEAGPRPRPQAPTPTPAPVAPAANSPAPADSSATTVLAGTSSSQPTLIGPDGQTLALTTARHTVGRLPDSDLHLDDTTVSRQHAAVVRRGDRWWVLDLGSTNGTRVNGITAAEQPLSDGDEIEFGEVLVTFRAGS
jgi:hypothetical protein